MKQKGFSGMVLLLLLASMVCMAGDSFLPEVNSMAIAASQQNGAVRNASNAQIGRIESNGTVRNSLNAQIGKIESSGTIRDCFNPTMGSASGVKKEWAAVFFFLISI